MQELFSIKKFNSFEDELLYLAFQNNYSNPKQFLEDTLQENKIPLTLDRALELLKLIYEGELKNTRYEHNKFGNLFFSHFSPRTKVYQIKNGISEYILENPFYIIMIYNSTIYVVHKQTDTFQKFYKSSVFGAVQYECDQFEIEYHNNIRWFNKDKIVSFTAKTSNKQK